MNIYRKKFGMKSSEINHFSYYLRDLSSDNNNHETKIKTINEKIFNLFINLFKMFCKSSSLQILGKFFFNLIYFKLTLRTF